VNVDVEEFGEVLASLQPEGGPHMGLANPMVMQQGYTSYDHMMAHMPQYPFGQMQKPAMVGQLTLEDRRIRILRYLEKRSRRFVHDLPWVKLVALLVLLLALRSCLTPRGGTTTVLCPGYGGKRLITRVDRSLRMGGYASRYPIMHRDCARKRMHTLSVHTHAHTCTHMHTHAHMHTCTHAHTHAHTCTYMHIHAHTQ
jgi:hypothetical protein